MLAALAKRHPHLQIHASYSDRFVDLITEGFDCAIRVGYLQGSNLIARRVGPFHGRLVASPDYVAAHGEPQTPHELSAHEALMQGTETWQFSDGDRVVSVQPQGRFKADSGSALVPEALAGIGIAWLPDCLVDHHISSGALLSILVRFPPPLRGIYVVRPAVCQLS